MINKRQLEGTPRSRPRSFVQELPTPGPPATPGALNVSQSDESVADVDKLLTSALSSHEMLHNNLMQVVADFKEVRKCDVSPSRGSCFSAQKLSELDKSRVELQNTKRQCELVKSLLADATAEKEIMYEVSVSQ